MAELEQALENADGIYAYRTLDGGKEERARVTAPHAFAQFAFESLQQLKGLERELREGMRRGDASPFLLAAIEGPVSVNPIGIFEGLLEFRHYPPHSLQTRWASFNVGEFLWPQSRWS